MSPNISIAKTIDPESASTQYDGQYTIFPFLVY